MINRKLNRYVAALVCLGLIVGCETTGQSTAGGAALGGLAGGIIGHQSGHTWEGAAIGAAIGGLAGYAIGVTKEKQRLSRAQYEEQMRSKGEVVPQQPVVKLEELQSTPQTVKPGQAVQVSGTYLALGTDSPPVGTMRLMKDNKVIAEKPLEVTKSGESDFSKTINMPKDAASGTYVVQVDMKHANSTDSKVSTFVVA